MLFNSTGLFISSLEVRGGEGRGDVSNFEEEEGIEIF